MRNWINRQELIRNLNCLLSIYSLTVMTQRTVQSCCFCFVMWNETYWLLAGESWNLDGLLACLCLWFDALSLRCQNKVEAVCYNWLHPAIYFSHSPPSRPLSSEDHLIADNSLFLRKSIRFALKIVSPHVGLLLIMVFALLTAWSY